MENVICVGSQKVWVGGQPGPPPPGGLKKKKKKKKKRSLLPASRGSVWLECPAGDNNELPSLPPMGVMAVPCAVLLARHEPSCLAELHAADASRPKKKRKKKKKKKRL